MEKDDLWISKIKLLELRLVSIGPSLQVEEYDEFTGEPSKYFRSDTTDFVFEDRLGNKYIHGQVNPSSLPSKQIRPAQAFLRAISNQKYSYIGDVIMDSREDNSDGRWDKWQEFVGNYYSCCVRMKKWGNHITRHVESIFYDFPTKFKNQRDEHFENIEASKLSNDAFVKDDLEMLRIKMKYEKAKHKKSKKSI